MQANDVKVINAIRTLSADAIQKANSGHPGTPLGAAPMAYALWAKKLKHNPADPAWRNRDRFVLSAGHASMLLYSLLHLFGYGLTMDDLKNFRQLDSRTPGHPEYGHTVGVETTTGPLGQGVSNAVGMAMAEKHLAAKFNRPGFPVVDHYTYALMGDGCVMEGISGEASALAATLSLGKLILFYDSNDITIEGNVGLALREDTAKRYEAYGWHVQKVDDGEDIDAIAAAIDNAKADPRPSLIVVTTKIGAHCPAKEGKNSAHGEPLGEENVRELKKNLGLDPDKQFFVEPEAYEACAKVAAAGAQAEAEWDEMVKAYAAQYPELYKEMEQWYAGYAPDLENDEAYWEFADKKDATRNTSGIVLGRLAERIPNLIGGSADLAPSNKTYIKGRGDFSAETPEGSNLHFGIREQAMAGIVNGMQVHGGLQTYAATFLVFSDYMKHGIRLSALMKLPVLYVLTHDSIGVGEDGPTHQPIEHLAALRSMPNVYLWRPADGKETAAAYAQALKLHGPSCFALSRQNLPQYAGSGKAAMKGGYVLSDSKKAVPDVILMASGSEVEQVMEAQQLLAEEGVDARVVSMPCFAMFDAQSEEYKESVLPKAVRARLAVEAATSFGWHKYVGLDGDVLTLDHFGASAPAGELFSKFGFTARNVADKAKALVK
ncbi:MAG: transketolase [Candidatus Spyradocola sp.]|nr:transketolase [Candidatus Spyradocola sp.]